LRFEKLFPKLNGVPDQNMSLFVTQMIKLMTGDMHKINDFVPGIEKMSLLSDIGTATVELRKENFNNKININCLHQVSDHCCKTNVRLTGVLMLLELSILVRHVPFKKRSKIMLIKTGHRC
jgi:hypothetical protein